MLARDKVIAKPTFFLQFKQCTFEQYLESGPYHPQLQVSLSSVKHLALIDQRLGDNVFDAIFDRALAIESFDISYNQMCPESVLRFLKKLTDKIHDEN